MGRNEPNKPPPGKKVNDINMERLAFTMTSLVGRPVIVNMVNGAKISGLFHTFDLRVKGDQNIMDVCLNYAQEIAQGNKLSGEIHNKIIIPGSKYTTISALSVPLKQPDVSVVTPKRMGFQLDLDISKGQTGPQRELERWNGGDDIPFTGTDLNLEATDEQWDQFAVNEEKFGVKSTYDINKYTTHLDESTIPDFVLENADRLAKEESDSRLHDLEDETQDDEENRFAAILRRPAETTNPSDIQKVVPKNKTHTHKAESSHVQNFSSVNNQKTKDTSSSSQKNSVEATTNTSKKKSTNAFNAKTDQVEYIPDDQNTPNNENSQPTSTLPKPRDSKLDALNLEASMVHYSEFQQYYRGFNRGSSHQKEDLQVIDRNRVKEEFTANSMKFDSLIKRKQENNQLSSLQNHLTRKTTQTTSVVSKINSSTENTQHVNDQQYSSSSSSSFVYSTKHEDTFIHPTTPTQPAQPVIVPSTPLVTSSGNASNPGGGSRPSSHRSVEYSSSSFSEGRGEFQFNVNAKDFTPLQVVSVSEDGAAAGTSNVPLTAGVSADIGVGDNSPVGGVVTSASASIPRPLPLHPPIIHAGRGIHAEPPVSHHHLQQGSGGSIMYANPYDKAQIYHHTAAHTMGPFAWAEDMVSGIGLGGGMMIAGPNFQSPINGMVGNSSNTTNSPRPQFPAYHAGTRILGQPMGGLSQMDAFAFPSYGQHITSPTNTMQSSATPNFVSFGENKDPKFKSIKEYFNNVLNLLKNENPLNASPEWNNLGDEEYTSSILDSKSVAVYPPTGQGHMVPHIGAYVLNRYVDSAPPHGMYPSETAQMMFPIQQSIFMPSITTSPAVTGVAGGSLQDMHSANIPFYQMGGDGGGMVNAAAHLPHFLGASSMNHIATIGGMGGGGGGGISPISGGGMNPLQYATGMPTSIRRINSPDAPQQIFPILGGGNAGGAINHNRLATANWPATYAPGGGVTTGVSPGGTQNASHSNVHSATPMMSQNLQLVPGVINGGYHMVHPPVNSTQVINPQMHEISAGNSTIPSSAYPHMSISATIPFPHSPSHNSVASNQKSSQPAGNAAVGILQHSSQKQHTQQQHQPHQQQHTQQQHHMQQQLATYTQHTQQQQNTAHAHHITHGQHGSHNAHLSHAQHPQRAQQHTQQAQQHTQQAQQHTQQAQQHTQQAQQHTQQAQQHTQQHSQNASNGPSIPSSGNQNGGPFFMMDARTQQLSGSYQFQHQ